MVTNSPSGISVNLRIVLLDPTAVRYLLFQEYSCRQYNASWRGNGRGFVSTIWWTVCDHAGTITVLLRWVNTAWIAPIAQPKPTQPAQKADPIKAEDDFRKVGAEYVMQRSQFTHGSAPRVLLLMREVVLALHWHSSLTYREIEDMVGVKERTASELEIGRASCRERV